MAILSSKSRIVRKAIKTERDKELDGSQLYVDGPRVASYVEQPLDHLSRASWAAHLTIAFGSHEYHPEQLKLFSSSRYIAPTDSQTSATKSSSGIQFDCRHISVANRTT